MPFPLLVTIICAGTIMALSIGVRQTFGLFLDPVSLELGLGREVFALSIGLSNLVWGLAAPVAGAVADRLGARRVATLGGLAYACGLGVMAVSGEGGQLLVGGLLVGLGLSGAGFTVVLGAVGRAAPPENQSMALGLASMGGSIGQFAALPFAQVLLDRIGWADALLIIAAGMLIVIPVAFGLSRPATDGAYGDADPGVMAAVGEAGGECSFRLLTAGFFVCGFHLAFIAVHFPAYVSDLGYPPWLAAKSLILVGLCNIVGTFLCGALGQRFAKKSVLSLIYLARAAIILVFVLAPVSETSILAFGAAMGFLWLGTVPLTTAVVAVIFGPRYLSTLFGIVFFSHQVGGFLGAWLAGAVFDTFASYDLMWWLSIALGAASAALHWPINERPLPRRSTAPG